MLTTRPLRPEPPEIDSALFFLVGVFIAVAILGLTYLVFGDVIGMFIQWYIIGPG